MAAPCGYLGSNPVGAAIDFLHFFTTALTEAFGLHLRVKC